MYNSNISVCLNFMGSMIGKHPDNAELIKAYTRIVEKWIDLEITYLKGDEELRKDWEKNMTERIKSDDAVRKTSIERNASIMEGSSI